MVIIKGIKQESGSYKPSEQCDLIFGNYFDGENYNYFESIEEAQKWKDDNYKEIEEIKPKTDLSNIDIDSLTDEQLIKIATRLKNLS